MKTLNAVKLGGAIVFGSMLLGAEVQATVAYYFPIPIPEPGLTANMPSGTAQILANTFQVNQSILVNAIGVMDNNIPSWGDGPIPLAFYKLTGGNWNVVPGSSASLSDGLGSDSFNTRYSQYPSLLTLTPGTYAVVAANLATVDHPAFSENVAHADHTIDPIFQSGGGLISMTSAYSGYTAFHGAGSTLGSTYPVGTFTGAIGGGAYSSVPVYAGPTFQYNKLTAVPEADTYSACAVGLLAIVYVGRARLMGAKKTA